VIEDGPGGWKTTGNTGGGHTGHDGKVFNKQKRRKRLIFRSSVCGYWW